MTSESPESDFRLLQQQACRGQITLMMKVVRTSETSANFYTNAIGIISQQDVTFESPGDGDIAISIKVMYFKYRLIQHVGYFYNESDTSTDLHRIDLSLIGT
jgi:hypothetical protein